MSAKTPQIRHIRETLLSDNWYTLKKYTYEIQRRDGRWQQQTEETGLLSYFTTKRKIPLY